jgi:hypothetical protein
MTRTDPYESIAAKCYDRVPAVVPLRSGQFLEDENWTKVHPDATNNNGDSGGTLWDNTELANIREFDAVPHVLPFHLQKAIACQACCVEKTIPARTSSRAIL